MSSILFRIPGSDSLRESLLDQSRRRRLIRITAAAAVFLCSLYVLTHLHHDPSFPALPAGSFIGTLETPPNSKEPPLTLYAERLGSAPSILFVVFSPEWKPQVVTLRPLGGGDGSAEVRPVTLRHGEHSLLLTGEEAGSGYTGQVDFGTGGAPGSWNLTKVSGDELKASKKFIPMNLDMQAWMSARMTHRRLDDEFSGLQQKQEEDNEKIARLERFLSNGEILRDRSESRRTEISDELNRLSEQRKKSTQELRSAMDDLGLLQRATSRGQAVELARKISRRENKWYSVKWGNVGATDAVDEQFAEKNQVDPQKLQASLRRAEEIQKLRGAVADERQKIRQLERALNEQYQPAVIPPVRRAPERREAPQQPEERRPWWKVWDGF